MLNPESRTRAACEDWAAAPMKTVREIMAAVEGWPAPNPEPHTLIPVHNLCLFKVGIPLGETVYTQELATWLGANGRSSFLLTAPPLRLPGSAGGPLNPIETV